MKNKNVVEIEVGPHEHPEKALRRFKRLCEACGIRKEYRKRKEYKKPSVRLREKRETAEKRRAKTEKRFRTGKI